MAQVYACVHDGLGNFFIGVKNKVAYFFHSNGGKVYPSGTPITNGPGDPALPGGKLEYNDPAIGAAEELLEETGVQIRDFAPNLKPDEWHKKPDGNEYYGVYFQVSPEQFKSIVESANSNIKTGVTVAEQIAKGVIKSYAAIHQAFGSCPLDNELASGLVLNITTDWEKIKTFESKDTTSWYFDILLNLKNSL